MGYSIDRAMVIDSGCPLRKPRELLENVSAQTLSPGIGT